MSRFRSLAAIVLIAAVGWSCGSTTQPPTPQPTAIQLNKTTVSFDALTATDQLSASVLDQDGQSLSGQPLTWSSSAAGVATVSSSGLVTAVGNGQATITATSGSLTGDVAVTVAQALTQIVKAGGDGQAAEAGQVLSDPIVVEVRDRLGQPIPGSVAGGPVAFAVATGGGMVASASATVDASGQASTTWTLGTMAGAQTVAASAMGGTLSATFSATANTGPPTTVMKAAGDAQTGTVATPLGTSLVVHVEDQFANPVAGANVDFVVTQGGGSIAAALAGSSASLRAGASGPAVIIATDANGDAVAEWTLGNPPGANEVTYTVGALPPGTFTATGELGPPDTVIVTAGDAQTATVNTAVSTAPSVQVVDVGGNPLAGESVDFTVTGGGGSVTGGSTTTDGSGNATVGSWTLGTTAGANELTATAGTASSTIDATGTPDAPAMLTINDGDGQMAVAGTAVATPPSVVVADQFGNGLQGESVDFAVTAGAGSVNGSPATTDTDGIGAVTDWTLGPTPGVNTIEASSGALTPVTFTATGVAPTPDMVVVNAGDNQAGLIGAPVNIAPSVLVTSGGVPIANQTVTFAVTGGGGSVMNNVAVTNADGIAQVGEWTLGSGVGVNTLGATVTGMGITGNPVTFAATGQASEFNIVLQYTVMPTGVQQEAFDSAAAYWSRIIIGDLTDGTVSTSAGECGSNDPGLSNQAVDDLYILVTLDSIDGPGTIIGSASPCQVRANLLPILGQMTFDTADIAGVDLEAVALHEMGHVLGFGTLWGPGLFDLLRNPSLPNNSGADTYFDGPIAQAEFDSVGGVDYTGGAKVPVENTQGGQGTRDAHWRESVFDAELMTGFTETSGAMPLSSLTIASMWDLGYVVNLSAAQPYSQTFSLRAGPPIDSGLRDEIWRGPIYIVDSRGRVIRVVQPQ